MKKVLWIVQYQQEARNTFPVRDAAVLNFAVAAGSPREAKKIVEDEYELNNVQFVETLPWNSNAISGITLTQLAKQKKGESK